MYFLTRHTFLTAAILILWITLRHARGHEQYRLPALDIDLESTLILDSFKRYYGSLGQLDVHVETTIRRALNAAGPGAMRHQRLRIEWPDKVSYTVERPNDVSTNTAVVCDGQVVFCDETGPLGHKYAVVDAPDTLAELTNLMGVRSTVYGRFANEDSQLPISLLDSDPIVKLFESARVVRYKGIVNIEDRDCYLIVASAPGNEWTLWIEVGDRPIIRRVVSNQGRCVARVTAWNDNPRLPGAVFIPNTPADAVKTRSTLDSDTGDGIDPKASTILHALEAHLHNLKAFHVAGLERDSTVGYSETRDTVIGLNAERPCRVALRIGERDSLPTLVCDGVRHVTYSRKRNRYLVAKAPTSLDELRDAIPAATMMDGMSQYMAMQMLLSDDPIADLLSFWKVASLKYVGRFERHERRCDLLQGYTLMSPQFLLNVWIDTDGPPLLRGLSLAHVELAKNGIEQVVHDEVWMQTWDEHPQFDSDTFSFSEPDDAIRVDSIRQFTGKPHALINEPAPTIKGSLVDGGAFNSSAYKGQAAVVLDFWKGDNSLSQWRRATVAKAIAGFKNHKLVLVSINVAEEAEAAALSQDSRAEGLMLIDKTREIANAYKVQRTRQSITPQTVLVDSSGTVRSVLEGYSPDLEFDLRAGLSALLSPPPE